MNKTDHNYNRALTWTAFMTYLSQCHPSFGSVFAIEAVNEPLMDATQTPGLGECKSCALVASSTGPPESPTRYSCILDRIIVLVYQNFVQTVRLVEWFLQTKLPEFQATGVAPTIQDLKEILVAPSTGTMDWPGPPVPVPVIHAFVHAFRMLLHVAGELNWQIDTCPSQDLSPLTTKFVFFCLLSLPIRGDGLIGLPGVSVSWMPSGNTIALPTPRTLPMALRLMTTTCTTG
jgi:hypothetical protein